MPEYILSIKNDSTLSGDFCIYQKHPSHGDDILSLKWFSKQSLPGTGLSFQWDSVNSFPQSEIGKSLSSIPEARSNNTVMLPPQPQYWIAFGDFEEGEMLDMSRAIKTKQLVFPEGGGELAIILDEHGNLRSDS